MSEAQASCPADSRVMIAWKAHQASEAYANSHSWATRYIPPDDPEEIERIRQSDANPYTQQMKIQAVEGSLWACFIAGWNAAGGDNPFTPREPRTAAGSLD